MGDAETFEHFPGPGAAGIGDVLLHGHVREERVLLEDETDASLLRQPVDPCRRVEEHAAVERDPPALGPDESGDRAQDARLARAGGADERERLAPDRER